MAKSIFLIIASLLIGIFLGIPIQRWFEKNVLDKASDIHVFVYGYEHSYTLHQLKNLDPNVSTIIISPVKFPENIDTINPNVLLEGIDWKGMDGKKLFVIVIENRGEVIAQNTKVTFDITPHIIDSITIKNQNRLEVIEGGYLGSRVVVFADELTSRENQYFEIVSSAKEIKSIRVQTDDKNVEKIFVFDVSITPGTSKF
jgi:hypothetical protein